MPLSWEVNEGLRGAFLFVPYKNASGICQFDTVCRSKTKRDRIKIGNLTKNLPRKIMGPDVIATGEGGVK